MKLLKILRSKILKIKVEESGTSSSSSEGGGGWFFLSIEPQGPILKEEAVSQKEFGIVKIKLEQDGISPVLNEAGSLVALDFEKEFWPGHVPDSILYLAQFLKTGTIITLDNGCWPSIEWKFSSVGVEAIDTYDNSTISTSNA